MEANNLSPADQVIQDAFQKAFEANNGHVQTSPTGDDGLDFSPREEVKSEPTTEAAAEVKVEDIKEPVSVEAPKEEQSSLTQKTFEELLAEKTAGKFKSWDELEKTISTPKEREFKSDYSRKLEEFIENGGDEESFHAIQSINFDKMSAKEILEYKIQSEDPDMSQKEIDYELKKRYGIDKWKDDALDYEEGSEPEEISIQKLRFNREAERAKNDFKAHQQKMLVLPKKENTIDPQKEQQAIDSWNSKVGEALNQTSKLSAKISDTEVYDFVLDETEKGAINSVMQGLRSDATKIFEPFKQSDGGYDLKGIADMIAKARNFDKFAKLIADQASKQGQKAIVKDLKNTNFTPSESSTGSDDRPLSREQQIAKAFADSVKNNR